MPIVPLFICFSFYFFLCFSLRILSVIFYYLWTFICYFHPSFGPAISRSDPCVGNYCIFNPDLDNGTVTVIFAPGLFAGLRPFMSLTLCVPPLPIIATHWPIQSHAKTVIMSMQHHIFNFKSKFLFSEPFPQTMFSLFVHSVCGILVMSSQLLGLNRWSSFTVYYSGNIWKGHSAH